MRILKGLVIGVVLLSVCWAAPSYAVIDWEEGFETYANSQAMLDQGLWGASSCNAAALDGVMTPSTIRKHSGSKSLREIFSGLGGTLHGQCFFDGRQLSSPSNVLYTRFWMYMTGVGGTGTFTVEPSTGTKVMRHDTNGLTSNWWGMPFGNPVIGVGVQAILLYCGQVTDPGAGCPTPKPTIDTQLRYGNVVLPMNTWFCVETEERVSTPGLDDGVIGSWITLPTGTTQQFRYTNQRLRQVGDNSQYYNIRLYTQVGLGEIFYDDIATSRDARIGCGGTPPIPDTTPPPVVGTPTAVGGFASVAVSWGPVIDGNGELVTYLVQQATASGGPYTTILTTTNTAATATGLANSTTYYYRIVSRDPSGNAATPSGIASATTSPGTVNGSLSFNSSGKAVLNGTQKFLLAVSYFDYLNWHSSDIDLLAARGFNTIRVFSTWIPSIHGATRAVCAAAGTLQATQRNTMQALIDYAKTKNMIVDMVLLDEDTDFLIVNDANRQTCITNLVNYFSPTSAQANWNVIFDVVQEHDTEPVWAPTVAAVKKFTDTARTACPTCTIFSSGTFIAGFMGPADSTSALTATNQSNVAAHINTNGDSALAIHENRDTNWWSITGARVAAYRAYLNSIGRQSTPIFFDEPNRRGGGWSESSETEFNTAAGQAKSAGAALWLFHTDAAFDLSTQTFFQQLDAVESAITLSMAASLPTSTLPPTTPSLVTATPGVAQMIVAWSASIDTGGGIGGYHILRCTNPGCTGATPLADVGPLITTFLDTPLVANTTYGYQIVAFDLATPVKQAPASAIVYGTTPSVIDTTPPPVPVAPAVPSVGLPATYTWPAVINPGDLAGYNVYRKTEACNGPTPTSLIATLGNVLTYQDTTIPLTAAFICVQIASRDITGNVSALSTGTDEVIPAAVLPLAHAASLVTDKNGASLTFTGVAYAVRFWTFTLPVTIISGLGGVTTYRHSIAWPTPETTWVCYAAMDVNGTWENDVNAASYLCTGVDLVPPPPLGGIEISKAVQNE